MAVCRCLALISLLLVPSAPTAAHQPYFIEDETCTPGDGSFAKMRVLYGDGILAANPARVVLAAAALEYLIIHGGTLGLMPGAGGLGGEPWCLSSAAWAC